LGLILGSAKNRPGHSSDSDRKRIGFAVTSNRGFEVKNQYEHRPPLTNRLATKTNTTDPAAGQVSDIFKTRIHVKSGTSKLGRHDYRPESGRTEGADMVDFRWIFASIIVSFLICFCIVFLAKEVNHLAASQTELLLRTPDPVAVAHSSSESITETLEQSATPFNPPEPRSPSSNAFMEVASLPAQGIPSRVALNELATARPKSSRILMGKGKEFSVRRLASGRRVARAPRSIKALIDMWFRSFKPKSRR
jgi:hypothetical protein